MFQILNEATEEEIAIITTVVDILNNKKPEIKKELNNWSVSAKLNVYKKYSWNDKGSSFWRLSAKDF